MTIDLTKGTIAGKKVTYKEGALTVTLTARDEVDAKAGVWGDKYLRLYGADEGAQCDILFSEPVAELVILGILPGDVYLMFTDKDGNTSGPSDPPTGKGAGFLRIEQKDGTRGIKSVSLGLLYPRSTMIFLKEMAVTV